MTRLSTRAVAIAVALAVVTVGSGCAAREDRETIDVLAAASLDRALADVAAAFEAGRSAVRVRVVSAGSAVLAAQVERGAPGDVIVTADTRTFAQLRSSGLVTGRTTTVARNRLAIVVPAGNPRSIRTLRDLASRDLVVVLCGTEVPAGRYAQAALERAGVTLRPASLESSVAGVVAKVAMKEADAGIAYRTDVLSARSRVEGIALPPEHDVVADYPAGVLRDARRPALARAFVAFLTSGDGRRVLRAHGFDVP